MINLLKSRRDVRQSELDTAVSAFNAKNEAIAKAQSEQQQSVAEINVLVGKIQELDSLIAEASEA